MKHLFIFTNTQLLRIFFAPLAFLIIYSSALAQPGCSLTCQILSCDDEPDTGGFYCGNGIVESDEECDEGTNNGQPDSNCTTECKLSVCGDGIVGPDEDCDAGTLNGTIAGGCTVSCTLPVCGNNVKESENNEACDGADFGERPAEISVAKWAARICTDDCELTFVLYCGDGIKNAEEACDGSDLGDVVNPDASCNESCEFNPYCGDGNLDDNEQCDGTAFGAKPANVSDAQWAAKVCSTSCEVSYSPYCGDGVKSSNEECDDGNQIDNDACGNDCKLPVCGDGVLEGLEQCDAGTLNNNRENVVKTEGETKYYCSATCTFSEVEKGCVWIAAWADWSDGRAGDGSVQGVYNRVKNNINRYENVPNCFFQRWGCGGGGGSTGVAMKGNCGIGVSRQAFAAWLGTSSPAANLGGGNAAFVGHMDESCRYVANTSNYDICGYAGISWSPISLIFDESAYGLERTKIAEFALHPSSENKYSLWKASGSAPLLVYDPDSSGKVDATKLFGNWTFGGKDKSPIAPASLNVHASKMWDNGYQALAVLDKNSDGKINGNELESLALWFDYNQNAKVDEGELRKLRSEGILALYYRNPTNVNGSKDVELKLGYKRKINGKVVTGRSLDWYGESFASYKEALDSFSITNSINEPSTTAQLDKHEMFNFVPHQVSDHKQDVSGFWIWNTNDDKNKLHPAIFALEQKADGSITGYNAVESFLENNEVGLHSFVRVLPVEGKFVTTKNGSELQLKIQDTESGVTSFTTAKLGSDGISLIGEAKQNFFDAQQSNGKEIEIAYGWNAEKIVN